MLSTVALEQKILGFEAGCKSAYLLFPKREEKERERNTHVNALTGKTTVDALSNSERGSLMFSSQQPRGIRKKRMARGGEEQEDQKDQGR